MNGTVGILAHGNNHFILSGPVPAEDQALALARHFSLVRIGQPTSSRFDAWHLRDKEFRENLEWAVVVPGDRPLSTPVAELLAELRARNVKIDHLSRGCW